MAKDDITFEGFISKLRKLIRNSYQQVGDTMIAGGVTDMDQYKYLLGQAHAYQAMDQEISNLLNPKEQKNEQADNTNVIRLGDIGIDTED